MPEGFARAASQDDPVAVVRLESAAEILGVSLKTLHNKLKEYGRSREGQSD